MKFCDNSFAATATPTTGDDQLVKILRNQSSKFTKNAFDEWAVFNQYFLQSLYRSRYA